MHSIFFFDCKSTNASYSNIFYINKQKKLKLHDKLVEPIFLNTRMSRITQRYVPLGSVEMHPEIKDVWRE